MTRLMSRRHHNPAQIGGLCDGEATVIASSAATEIFLRCAPVASGTSKNGCRRQSDVLYDSLAQMLDELGAKMDHVVAERVFFRNVTTDFDDFQAVRLKPRSLVQEELLLTVVGPVDRTEKLTATSGTPVVEDTVEDPFRRVRQAVAIDQRPVCSDRIEHCAATAAGSEQPTHCRRQQRVRVWNRG